jgi:hypothetical protein
LRREQCTRPSAPSSTITSHLICRDGEFEELPDWLRQQGPWQVLRRGDITNLKRNYRLRLARDGYVLVHSELAVFKARGMRAGQWACTKCRRTEHAGREHHPWLDVLLKRGVLKAFSAAAAVGQYIAQHR